MRNSRFLIAASVIVPAVVLASSCEKDFLWGGKGRPGRSNSVGMKINGASSSSLFETKAGGSVKPENVFSSDDGGFTIEEYVSDIDADTPDTKGTEIKQLTAGSGNFNVDGRQFQVMAYIDTLNSKKEKVRIKEFDAVTKFNGSIWNWDCAPKDAPCWRDSTKYHIWSYWPLDSDLTASSRSTVSVPGWSTGDYTHVAFHHSVPKSLEAQQDLLFAYNEELRECKRDSKGNFPVDPATKEPIYELKTGQTDYFNIRFKHALAAVKFELNSTIAGSNIDVHSITLCVTDNTTAKNIILDGGIATSGYCEATGSVDTVSNVPTPKINFVWKADSLKNRKPLHYEFDSSHSVAGGYTETGKGILFMIPQTLPTGMKIIVEFSKNGSTNYNTKVLNLPAVTWAAGKYYTYRLKIGELHVPGENFTELVDVDIVGLKNSGDNIQPSSALSIKGVTKMGLVIDSWRLGSKAGQTVYLNAIIDGDSQVEYKTVDKVTSPDESNTDFNFNFAPVSESAVPGTNNKIYTFGTDNAEETYHKYYSFSPPTGGGKSDMGTPNIGPFYYVFNTTGASTFKIIFTPAAGDNSGGFFTDVRCLIVIEIAPDPDLPGNFNTIDWDNI